MNAFRDFGPVPWWAWGGKLEFPEMLRQLEQMKAVGIDEFFIYAGMGLEYPLYLEDSWFEYVGWTIEQAKRLDMHIWIYDELNWPTGTAMGKLPKLFPQYRVVIHDVHHIGDLRRRDQFRVGRGEDLPGELFDGLELPGVRNIADADVGAAVVRNVFSACHRVFTGD